MRPAQPWRLEPTLRFLALLLFSFAIAGLGWHALLLALGINPANQSAWQLACATGVLHGVGFLTFIPLLRAHQSTWSDAFGFFSGRRVRNLLLAVGLTVPALFAAWALHQGCVVVLEKFGIRPDTQAAVEAVLGATRPWEKAILLVFAAGSAPVFEEMVFRGVLWPFARDCGFRISGCLVVSFVFALIHANLAAMLPLWLLGIFWTQLYDRTGDLMAPILSHALFNATNFAWILLAPPDAG